MIEPIVREIHSRPVSFISLASALRPARRRFTDIRRSAGDGETACTGRRNASAAATQGVCRSGTRRRSHCRRPERPAGRRPLESSRGLGRSGARSCPCSRRAATPTRSATRRVERTCWASRVSGLTESMLDSGRCSFATRCEVTQTRGSGGARPSLAGTSPGSACRVLVKVVARSARARAPHCHGAVKRLRRSCASLRRLRRDCAPSARRFASMSLWRAERPRAAFVHQRDMASQKPAARGAVKVREATASAA
jgi:hypothetical protein